MTKKKQRRRYARIIRRETGIPMGLCHAAARMIVKSGWYSFRYDVDGTPLEDYVKAGWVTYCECCGPEPSGVEFTGPRGTIEQEDIEQEMSEIRERGDAARSFQKERARAKRERIGPRPKRTIEERKGTPRPIQDGERFAYAVQTGGSVTVVVTLDPEKARAEAERLRADALTLELQPLLAEWRQTLIRAGVSRADAAKLQPEAGSPLAGVMQRKAAQKAETFKVAPVPFV
jgi:hypothetical protein